MHLYAATFGLFIIAPRLLLAAAHGVHAAMLARRFPLDLDDPAFQRMAGARGLLLAVPYNYTIDTARGAGLNAVATALLGDEAAVRVAPGIASLILFAYLLTAEALGVAPETCAFIDDLEENVEAASAVGMCGILIDREARSSYAGQRIQTLASLPALLCPS